MNRTTIVKLMLLAALVGMTIGTFTLAYGHEAHGFKHPTENIGPIVETGRVADGTLVWVIENEDGTRTELFVIFSHGILHIKERGE